MIDEIETTGPPAGTPGSPALGLAPEPESLRLARGVQRLAAGLRVDVDAALAPLGIRLAGFEVLQTLWGSGAPFERTPSELCRTSVLTSGAMTSRLDTLERDGLIERRARSGADRRRVYVRLTPRGRRLIERACPTYEDVVLRRLDALDAREVAALANALEKTATLR